MSRLRVLMATGDEELMMTVNRSLPPKYPGGPFVSRVFKSGQIPVCTSG
jgi:hypothetical protein